MSHQVKQVSSVTIKDLTILAKAAERVFVPEINGYLKLDTERKSARYWKGRQDKCDAVLTFDRKLTGDEKYNLYEISLKATTNPETKETEYAFFADTHGLDRGIAKRVDDLYQEYRIEEIRDEISVRTGQIEVYALEGRPGWQRIAVTVPE